MGKITELPPAQLSNDADLYPVVQSANTRKQTLLQFRTALGIGPNVTSLNGLTGAADKVPYFTGLGTMALTTLTTAARQLMAVTGLSAMLDLMNAVASVSVASAATTNIGAAAAQNVTVTGTTTITSLGNVAVNTVRRVTFAGALTLTHNGTSLILPGAANLVTAPGDVARFISLGGGNWKLVEFQRAAGGPIAEQGTNYIKYADGRLECWGSIATFAAAANAVTSAGSVSFPVNFIDTTYRFTISGQPNTGTDTYGFVAISAKLVGVVTPYYRNGATAQNVVNTTWEARGRWK